jgi:hypothetical protein
MRKTTADVPRDIADEYKKAPRAHAVAEVTGDGYTTTLDMKKTQRSKGKSQFGLPKSAKVKPVRM